jgi:hypothetical protein
MADKEEVVNMPNKVNPYRKPLDQSGPSEMGLTIKGTAASSPAPSKSLKDYGDSLKKITKD